MDHVISMRCVWCDEVRRLSWKCLVLGSGHPRDRCDALELLWLDEFNNVRHGLGGRIVEDAAVSSIQEAGRRGGIGASQCA